MNDSSQSEILAEETHSGRMWSFLILPLMIASLLATSLGRTTALIAPAVLTGVIGLGTMIMIWSGFQYRFLRHGVEIRMLGFRLRSIPRDSIISYSIEPWSFPRGYGIRGIGSTRAYVWCNQVVHITTTSGNIYLGHNDPKRIVRDLDKVAGNLHNGN